MTEIKQLRRKTKVHRMEIADPEGPELYSPRPYKLWYTAHLLKRISRDFNDLLTCIQGHVSLVLLDMDSGHPGIENLKDIEKCVQKGAELSKRLSISGEDIQPKKETTSLNDLISEYFEDLGGKKEPFVFRQRYQDEIWAVKADPEDIERLIRNIHDDSSRCVSAGGEIYVRTQNVILSDAYVRPHGLEPGKFVKISITYPDSGIKEGGFGVPDRGTVWVHNLIKKNGGILNIYMEEENKKTLDLFLPAHENRFDRQTSLKK